MKWFGFFLLFSFSLFAKEPPILFLTWKRDPQHCINVVWLTKDGSYEGVIQWKSGDDANFHEKAAAKSLITYDKEPFYLFQTQLNFLKPDQVYEFKIEREETVRKFKTAPADLDKPVRFIVGGDVYHDDISHVAKMMQAAAKFDPLFCILGGDLAYAFASKKCDTERIDRWFTLLSAYDKEMVTPEGITIPLIPVLGNHDIQGGFSGGVRNAKFFFTVFPMPGNTGYNSLSFGSYLTLLLLDSGHANPVCGPQSAWLQKTLEEKKESDYLFAIYHVGAYPSVRSFANKRAQEIRKTWVPLFDRYDITAAFEHHDHALKRTIPLKGNHPQEGGVIYLGDGSFGVGAPRTPWTPEQLWYLAHTASVQAVWGVTLQPKEAAFTALSVEGKVIDSTTKLSRKK